jgi:hypothetical protein
MGVDRLRIPLVLTAVAALVAAAVVAVRIVAADADGCSGPIALRVIASPEIAPVLDEVGASWMQERPQTAGKCIALTVDAAASATIASSLTVYAGRAIDVAAEPEPTPNADALPAVWVPDSTAWLTRVQTVDRAAFDLDAPSIASSQVVVAMPEAAARLVGWPGKSLPIASIKPLLSQGSLKLGIAEPRRETASLAATMVLGEALTATEDDLPALVKTFRSVVHAASTAELLRSFGPRVTAGPASEQAVLAYNATNPAVKLAPVQLDPVAPSLDYPYAVRSGIPRETAQAAGLFRRVLLESAAQEALARRAFRSPSGATSPGFPSSNGSNASSGDAFIGPPIADRAKIEKALGLWAAANSPSRTLALFDVTSSMGSVVQTSTGGKSRAQVMIEAAQSGLALFTSDSRVGMWAFSARHQEVMPIADLSAERTAEFNQRMAQAVPGPTNASPLYDTLTAAYRAMRDGYDPTRPNIIVVLTDGGDSNAGGVRFERFKQDLQRLAEATRPIRVVLIGIGVGTADAADLRKIAEVLGGGFFPLQSPEEIQTIFLRALLRVGAA